MQQRQVLRRLGQNALWRAVAGHAPALRNDFPNVLENHSEILRFANQRIAVCEKDALNIAVLSAGDVEILQNVLQLAQMEALFLVHITERAFIMAASHRNLYDQAVGLRRRTKNSAFISHRVRLLSRVLV